MRSTATPRKITVKEVMFRAYEHTCGHTLSGGYSKNALERRRTKRQIARRPGILS